ncbi:MAG: lipopolysaccharide biosynthesis protein, partial [Ignavibacteria bacterium]
MVSSESKKGIFTHTLVYSIGNFLSRGLNFILLPVYSHFIVPSDFGVYSVIISVVTIASTILNLGLPGIFVKNLSEVADAEQKKKFISNTISGISFLSLPFLLLIIFYSKQLSMVIIGDSQYNIEIILGVLSIYALNYSYYFSVFYVAEQNSKKYVLINSFAAIINFILNIILIVLLKSGINGIFISQILSSVFLIFLSGDVIKYFFRIEFDFKYLKPIMLSSLPLLLSGICTITVELIDRFIVLKILGEEQAGVYSFGYRIALIYNLFILSFKSAWIPHYFNLKKINTEKKAEHLGRVFTKLIFLSSIAILTILILTEIFFSVK